MSAPNKDNRNIANSERYQAFKHEAAKWQVEVSSAMQSQRLTHEQQQAELVDAARKEVRYEEEEARRAKQESARLRGSYEQLIESQSKELNELRLAAMKQQGVMLHAESVTQQTAEARYNMLLSGNRSEWHKKEQELEAELR